ncbi:hypothetical protein PENSPDRAFT_694708 [Peniophora sp. CONT]|nr:hypothetical protein PENSPDRAFT_694708 [Peniophora sp. CONT]
MAATRHNLPTLLPACYLFIADRFYSEVFDVKKASCWPSEIPLTVYSDIVRNMRQLLLLKRNVIDTSFSEDWKNEYTEDTSHRHQVAVLLKYFGNRNRVGEFYEEDLAIFQPE